jgi:hypothetical protein
MQTSRSRTVSRKAPLRRDTSQALAVPEALHQRIARRAYELYEARTRQGPLDDWLQAEREILTAG